MSKSKFDTRVQVLKYEVLRQLVEAYDKGDMSQIYMDIPKAISPGPKPSFRCCIYKERAIVQERLKLALGGDKRRATPVLSAVCISLLLAEAV